MPASYLLTSQSLCPYFLCLLSFWDSINVSPPNGGPSFYSHSDSTLSHLSKEFCPYNPPSLFSIISQCLDHSRQQTNKFHHLPNYSNQNIPWIVMIPFAVFLCSFRAKPQNTFLAFIHSLVIPSSLCLTIH